MKPFSFLFFDKIVKKRLTNKNYFSIILVRKVDSGNHKAVERKKMSIEQMEKIIYSLDEETLEEILKNLPKEQKLLVCQMIFFKKIFDNPTLLKKAQNIIGEMIYETLRNED